MKKAYGLTDAPLHIQYISSMLSSNLGISISAFPSPVTEVIATGLFWTRCHLYGPGRLYCKSPARSPDGRAARADAGCGAGVRAIQRRSCSVDVKPNRAGGR